MIDQRSEFIGFRVKFLRFRGGSVYCRQTQMQKWTVLPLSQPVNNLSLCSHVTPYVLIFQNRSPKYAAIGYMLLSDNFINGLNEITFWKQIKEIHSGHLQGYLRDAPSDWPGIKTDWFDWWFAKTGRSASDLLDTFYPFQIWVLNMLLWATCQRCFSHKQATQ